MDVLGTGLSAGVSIEYVNYSDDGLIVLNGTESFLQEPTVSYPANIEVSGCRSGFLRSDITLAAGLVTSLAGWPVPAGVAEVAMDALQCQGKHRDGDQDENRRDHDRLHSLEGAPGQLEIAGPAEVDKHGCRKRQR